jgi:hypothetical protein
VLEDEIQKGKSEKIKQKLMLMRYLRKLDRDQRVNLPGSHRSFGSVTVFFSASFREPGLRMDGSRVWAPNLWTNVC